MVNEQQTSRPLLATVLFFGALVALVVALVASIGLGAVDIKAKTVWDAVFHFNQEKMTHQIIQELRLPRALAAALVGAFLAVSGTVMQGLTRNPLADPSILGITAGSAFALSIVFAFWPQLGMIGIITASFMGALVTALFVFAIAAIAKGGVTPVKLALAGAAITALLGALSTLISLKYQVAQDLSFWFAGGLSGTKWLNVHIAWPTAIVGLLMALAIAKGLTVLSFGETVAKSLGQRTFMTKVGGTFVVILLTGVAVSIVGSVGFIGLIVPHITRFLVGHDYRVIVPVSAVFGALLLVLADIGARMINPPFETPVGAITALLGVPFFLYLARQDRREVG